VLSVVSNLVSAEYTYFPKPVLTLEFLECEISLCFRQITSSNVQSRLISVYSNSELCKYAVRQHGHWDRHDFKICHCCCLPSSL